MNAAGANYRRANTRSATSAPRDLSVSSEKPGNRSTQSSLGERCDEFPDGARLRVFGRVARLVQPPGQRRRAFIYVLQRNKIRISMDGRSAWRDNVFVERLWKSVKYGEVYPHAYSVAAPKAGIQWLFLFLQQPAARSLTY